MGRILIRIVRFGLVWLVAGILAGVPGPALALEDELSAFDFLLLGFTVRPEPESQVVPRNVATGIRVEVSFADTSADAASLLSLLPPGVEVAAELVGPGIDSPVPLRASPGELLPIPPLVTRGLYLVRDLRLEKAGETFLRGNPDTATVEVIDQILLTQVTTRPLTLEEIRQLGILFGDDDFTGFQFTLALKLDSKPVTVDFPVVFDRNLIPVPLPGGSSLSIHGPSLPGLGGASVVPVLLEPDIDPQKLPEVQDLIEDLTIPGLVVFPGDVGFLNQFFSAILLVTNGAPPGSALQVSALTASIELPPGSDGVPGTGDDPLEIAETSAGGRESVLPILGIGPDGVAGTPDDASRFAPGEQGQAEFLLEGRKEGFHTIDFDITGTLEGLPVGPVDLIGKARGGVLVRNPFFNLTFSAPATVRRGEEFSLHVTVTNVSQAIANAVRVSLEEASLSGAQLLDAPPGPIETLLPGDSEVVTFRFVSNVTGQVTASYLRLDQAPGGLNDAELRFHLGVGERGVPLSPDTIVLPASAGALPATVVSNALRVLGQAWSVATAPPGTLPQGVTRIGKAVVLDRATELAEAGFRVQLGEPLDRASMSLALSWLSGSEIGFDQILRETDAGRDLFASIGGSLSPSGGIADFQKTVSEGLTSLAPHLVAGVGSGGAAAPIEWSLRDALGRSLDPVVDAEIPNAAFLAAHGLGRGLAVASRLTGNLYEFRFRASGAGAVDLSFSVPQPDGSIGFYRFDGIALAAGHSGKVTVDLSRTAPSLDLLLDRDGDGIFEASSASSPVQTLVSRGPVLLGATAIGPETLSGADPWGRVVALLFDREVRAAEANQASRYQVEANAVLSAIRQLSGRLVLLFLRDPVGSFVARQATVSALFDARGRPMTPASASRVIASRLREVAAVVSGRVRRADGRPIAGASILYANAAPGKLVGISAKKTAPDGSYQFDWVRRSPFGPFSIRATDPETGALRELTTEVHLNGEHLVVDLVLFGRGGVVGTVRDLLGQPAAGARVLVTSQIDTASFSVTETDGAGRYQASNLVVGPVAVTAVKGTASGVASGNIQRAGTFANVDVTLNAGSGRVSGRVFEQVGDVLTPIFAARVYHAIPHPSSPGLEIAAASTQTAPDGRYSFDGVPTGPFRIVAFDAVTGRQAASSTRTLTAGAALEDMDVFFSSEAVGAIQGTVTSASGTPVEGALVTAAGRQVVTDALGAFLFDTVPVGRHGVTARVAASSRSASTRVEVLAGETAIANLVLPGVGQVLVTVLDPLGVPVASQKVFQLLGSDPCAGVERTTDASGRALFEEVLVPGGAFKASTGSDVAQGSALVQRDGDAAALTLQFSGFGTVTGRVLDPEGDPVQGADVVLGSRRFDFSTCTLLRDHRARQVRTGLDGLFRFENVPVGPIRVSASSFFLRGEASATDVLLAAGDTRDFTLTLSSTIAGELSGTVFLPDGETPAGPGVFVTVSSPSFPEVTVETKTDGRFQFAKILPAGTYSLTAADPVTAGVAKKTIAILADQALETDLHLLGRGAVEVTVVDGAGVPIEEAFVELTRASFPFDEAVGAITPQDGGTILFPRITEGDFTVTARDDQGRGGRASGKLGGENETARVTVELTVTGTVIGTLRTTDGSAPVPNAELRLRQGTTGRLLGSTTTSSLPGSLGRFEFPFVPAGSVLATATDPLTGRIGEASGRIETQDQVLALEIRLLGLGSVAGRVTSGGSPMPGATVEIVSSTGLSSALANLRATASSDAEGRFAFEGVPVGSFTLTATVPGLALTGTASGSITMDGESIADVEIALEPSGAIAGTVFRADRTSAVPGAAVRVETARTTLRTETSGAGDFHLDFVPAGDFTLLAEESASGDAGIHTGALSEGQILEVEVFFNGTGTILGTALASDGVTLLTAGQVRLTRLPPFARDETTTVGPDGRFRFSRVPVGPFTLSLSAPGSPLRGTASGEIPADGEAVPIAVRLADSGAVLGRVVQTDGVSAAPNVLVTVSGGGFSFNDLTGPTGAFRIEGVPLGGFQLRAEDVLGAGLALASGAVSANGEEVDLGTLRLDDSPIAVASVSPDGSAAVPPDTPIVVRFTDPLAPGSLSGRFQVRSGGVPIAGGSQLSSDGLELTFTPHPSLPPRSAIEVFLSAEITDTLGRKLGADVTRSFETSGAVLTGIVRLGSSPVAGTEVTLTAGTESRSTGTSGSGLYRFEDVPAGSVRLQAVDAASGQAGSVVVDLGPADGVVTRDIALGFTGNVTGRIGRFDGTDAGAGIEVRILQAGDPVGLAFTDENGRYLATHVPLGSFVVDARDAATGDRGQASGSLATGGATAEVEVQLLGVGSVRLVVKDATGVLVGDAEASLIFTRFGETFRLESPSREGNGSLLFAPVLAGPFSATARDPDTGLTASGSGTAVAAQEVLVELVLQPTGALAGRVVTPSGASPVEGATVRLFRSSLSASIGETLTDAEGGFRFENVPVGGNPHRIDVLLGGRLRARQRDVLVPANGEAVVEIRLAGLGTVTGNVIAPPGRTLSSTVRVNLTSLAPDLGGFFSDPNAADGTYEIAGVPVGPFRLSASDPLNGFLGEAAGAIDADGETVSIDIQLVDNAISFGSGRTLLDANANSYRVVKSGALEGGTDSIFLASDPGGLHLEVTVGGEAPTRFSGADVGSQEESGRELVTASEEIGGLSVRRKIYVPQEGYFARYLDRFENLTGESVGFSVHVVSNLRGSQIRIVTASSGATDWLVVDDAHDSDPFESSSMPATAFVLAGESGGVSPPQAELETIGSSEARLTVRYDLSLAPGQRITLLHFVSQQLSRDAATLAATRLSALPPEALNGLGPDEAIEIANFAVPADGTSALPPLPPLDGRVFGELLAHANEPSPVGLTTGTGGLQVQFQSEHPLFRRIRRTNIDAAGRFGFQSFFSANQSVAIPRVDYHLSSTRSISTFQTTASAGARFAPTRTLASRSPQSIPDATSFSGSSFSPDRAFDGVAGSFWSSANGDVANQGAAPALSIAFPAPVVVEAIRLDTRVVSNSEIFRVRFELMTDGGPFVLERDLPAPGRDLDLVLDVPVLDVSAVRVISLEDRGSFIGIHELEVIGTTETDIGSSIQDLVFTGSAAISGTARRPSGDGTRSSLTFLIGTVFLSMSTNDEGEFFAAPIPVEAGRVEITATASVGHPFLKASGEAFLSPDTTTSVDLVFPEVATISGRVLSAAGEPIPSRNVTLFPAEGNGVVRTTNANGDYLFSDVPSGSYTLRVVEGNRAVVVPVTVNAPAPVVQDIQIPLFGVVDLTVLFEPPGSLQPAAFAQISVQDSLDTTFRSVGSTNASGQIVIQNVVRGAFRLRITHPANPSSITEVERFLDADALSLTEHIPAFGTVAGTVRFADGTPAGNSRVEIAGDGITPKFTFSSSFSTSLGRYTLTQVEGLRPFEVTARHPNRSHLFARATGQIPAQGATEAIDLALPATGTVELTVLESDGTPIASAAVFIRDSFSTEFRSESSTNVNGQRTISFVPEGPFTVKAEKSGSVIGEVSAEVASHGQVVAVTIVREEEVNVDGHVLAGDGETPIGGARVELRSQDGTTFFRSVLAGENGFFRFDRAFAPGETRLVRAILPDDASRTAEAEVTSDVPGDTVTLSLEVPVSVVKGRVLDADGMSPVAGATVELTREGLFDLRTRTASSEGGFVFFDVPQGAFELFAEDAFGLAAALRAELPAGELSLERDVVLPPSGTVEGTVTDAFGTPLSDSTVELRSASLRAPRWGFPDEGGFFRFERVALGSFTLTYDEFTDAGHAPASATGRIGEIDPLATVNLVLPRTGTIFGRLLDRNGDPIPPATGLAPLFLEGRKHESGQGIYRERDGVGESGEYLVEFVPTGEITVTVREGGETGVAVATVVPGEEAERDVILGTALSAPIELGPPSGKRHTIEADGTLYGEPVFDEIDSLFSSVTIDTKFFPGLASAAAELSGRQIVFGPIATGGVLHTRKVFVPEDGSFTRFLEIFENPRGFDVELTVILAGELASSTLLTSSGGDRLGPGDRSFVVERADGAGASAVVFAGAGVVRAPDAARADLDRYEHEWRRITVPAGGRVLLMHFAVQADDLSSAASRADSLVNLTDDRAFSDLTAEEREQVVNFRTPLAASLSVGSEPRPAGSPKTRAVNASGRR